MFHMFDTPLYHPLLSLLIIAYWDFSDLWLASGRHLFLVPETGWKQILPLAPLPTPVLPLSRSIPRSPAAPAAFAIGWAGLSVAFWPDEAGMWKWCRGHSLCLGPTGPLRVFANYFWQKRPAGFVWMLSGAMPIAAIMLWVWDIFTNLWYKSNVVQHCVCNGGSAG